MNNLLNLILYIFKTHPKVNELSKPRLVKLIYLIDWKFAIDSGRQFTSIRWYYNHYGPYVDDVIDLIKKENEIFKVTSSINQFGSISERISLAKKDANFYLPDDVKRAADFIINNTAHMNWSEFINLVYSSFPVLSNSQYTEFNLEDDANRFREYRRMHENKHK